jgi:hypothetical protein
MRKVVDINYLQRPELEDYLKSKDNFIVLTDYTDMEMFKCNALESLACKLEIISRYPNQVIVLKETQELVSLTLTANKIPYILIDQTSTSGFSTFCNNAKAAYEGDELLSAAISKKTSYAHRYSEWLMHSHQPIVDGIKGIPKLYAPSDLKALRKGEELSEDFMDRITKNIIELTELLLAKHPDVKTLPKFDLLKNSYAFRFATCAYFLSLRWIKDGGIDQVSPEKLRNDVVDMSYATYATYFDGLLSMDKKMNELYDKSLNYLRYFDSCNE